MERNNFFSRNENRLNKPLLYSQVDYENLNQPEIQLEQIQEVLQECIEKVNFNIFPYFEQIFQLAQKHKVNLNQALSFADFSKLDTDEGGSCLDISLKIQDRLQEIGIKSHPTLLFSEKVLMQATESGLSQKNPAGHAGLIVPVSNNSNCDFILLDETYGLVPFYANQISNHTNQGSECVVAPLSVSEQPENSFQKHLTHKLIFRDQKKPDSASKILYFSISHQHKYLNNHLIKHYLNSKACIVLRKRDRSGQVQGYILLDGRRSLQNDQVLDQIRIQVHQKKLILGINEFLQTNTLEQAEFQILRDELLEISKIDKDKFVQNLNIILNNWKKIKDEIWGI